MKVYLAAQYPRRDEMREVARELDKRGVQVTSRWLQENLSLKTQLPDLTDIDLRQFAEVDSEDIKAADALVLFSEDPLVGLPRGTHHTEFGYALGLGKRTIVVGGYENVFHYLPGVIHYASLGDFLDAEGIQNATVAD
jgi:hypothetical protein